MTPTYEEEARFLLGDLLFRLRRQEEVDPEVVRRLKGFGLRYLREETFSHYSRRGYGMELLKAEEILKSD